MPTLETEIGVAIILAVAAGALLVTNRSSGDDTVFNNLLLMSILLQSIIPSFWALYQALRLTESYTRLRVPPTRSYWAGAFHVVGAASLTIATGLFVVLFLNASGYTRQLSQYVWDVSDDDDAIVEGETVNVGDILAVLGVHAVALLVGWQTKKREMNPETDMVVATKDRVTGKPVGAPRAGTGTGGFGWVPRGNRVRWWWMYGVANWFWVREGTGYYDMNWERHWMAEPVVDPGERLATLEDIPWPEVFPLRIEFWSLLITFMTITVSFLRGFWTLW